MSAKQTIIPVFVPHLGRGKDCVFCNQRRISGALRPVMAEEAVRAVVQVAAKTPAGAQRQLAFLGVSRRLRENLYVTKENPVFCVAKNAEI